jgi:formate-dependent nitrite reductase cytochrome c552 subunit
MGSRPSQRPANVAYYAANREREIERVTRRQAATTAFLRELREVPCADCGGRFAGHQMDFDHRDPRTKKFGLCTGRAALKSRAQLLAEASKCDIVCANCHRLRTRRWHRARLASRTLADGPRSAELRARWRYHAEVLDQLRTVPCADCGGVFAQCAMDFDHRDPASKSMRVTAMVGRAGIRRILAEVAKCDIVCANCHRLRTFERRLSRSALQAGVAQLVER